MLHISTENPEICQLSDSFKENVKGLIVMPNQTQCHLKHPQGSEDVDSLLRVGVKAFICELLSSAEYK